MPGNQLWRQPIQHRRPDFARNEDTETSSVGVAAVMASGVPSLYYSRRLGSKIKWEFSNPSGHDRTRLSSQRQRPSADC